MSAPAAERLDVSVYTVPTEEPESDGTFTWTETTVVVVEAGAEGRTGLGFTYATGACATLIRDVLAEVVLDADPFDVPGAWSGMVGAIRNLGRPGISSMAIAAVDTAMWDLKARLLDQPLASLLGVVHDEVAGYGSGGFTSLTDDELVAQLSGWAGGDGIPRVKLKVGSAWGSLWLRVAALAAAHNLEISAHCAQSLTAHPAMAAPNLRHLEYFADHARVDRLLFDGVLDSRGGTLRPDLSRPGMGLELKRPDAERYRKEH